MTAGSLKTRWIACGIVPLLGFALSAALARGQAPPVAGAGSVLPVSSSAGGEKSLPSQSPQASARSAGEIVREIDDPSSGQRWLLVRDDAHPGGPGLLLRAGGGPDVGVAGVAMSRGPGPVQAAADLPVIRSGDRVQVEEHSATVEARLEAVALTPAWLGSAFNARLAIGGQVVRAVALGPGRAAFQLQGTAVPAQRAVDTDRRAAVADQKEATR
jgi:hypothetical protein